MARAHLQTLKRDAVEALLEHRDVPGGADWMREARSAALARLREMGLPHGRDEYWRFTRPTDLTSPLPPEAAALSDAEAEIFSDADNLTLVFVDGVFDEAASDPLEMSGVELERLGTAMEKDIHWVKGLYGELEAESHDPVPRPMAAANTALATDGVVVRVTGKAQKRLHLVYLHHDRRSDAMLHHVIQVEEGAELTLLESGPAAARFNKVLEVDVADGAALHHVRVQGRDHERRAMTSAFARLGKESTFKGFTLTFNGVLTRNEVVVTLTGDDAIAHVAGACVGDGGDFHHDDTVFVTHDALNCESRQVFKKVLRNGATGVFQGKILVKDGAQKTDGYQISQSLLLDGDSQFLAKPELEIYADDVACSHGSTSGDIDEEGLFYLRSRGVPEAEATDMLTLAFLAEALDEIDDQGIADDLLDRLAGWLDRRRS